MAITLDTFKAQVDNLLSADNNELAVLARYRNIKAAMERYSRDLPDDYVEDEVGDGGKFYKLTGTSAVLANWVEGFSRVMEIEYPAVTIASDQTPVYLQPEDYRDDYWQGGDRYLFLPNHSPAATETMRIKFGVPYDWTASTVATAVTQTAHGFAVADYIYLDGSTWYKATDPRVATHKVTAKDTDTFTAVLLQADPPVQDVEADAMNDRSFGEALAENIEAISGSRVFVTLYHPSMAEFEKNPWPAIQLAIAILLDKPIVVACPKGRELPARLSKIADLVVEGGPEEIAEAVRRWITTGR